MEMTQTLREEFNAADIWTQHATRAVFFIGGFGAASWAPLVPVQFVIGWHVYRKVL